MSPHDPYLPVANVWYRAMQSTDAVEQALVQLVAGQRITMLAQPQDGCTSMLTGCAGVLTATGGRTPIRRRVRRAAGTPIAIRHAHRGSSRDNGSAVDRSETLGAKRLQTLVESTSSTL
jgi:hypothetical protein